MTFTPNVVGLVTIEIAGPEQFGLDELIRKGLSFQGDPREVVADPEARYYGASSRRAYSCPASMARRGQVAGGYAWWMTDNGPGVVRVRAARPDEVEALLGIQQAASVAGFRHIFPPARYPFPAAAVRARWRAALGPAEVCVLVAECDGLPVGVVEVAPERLDGLFVLPCAWGSGVADRLHDAAVQRLRGWGCGWCRLSVLEENQRARRFYERRGWRLDGRRTRTPFPPHPPMVGYTLTLGAASAAGLVPT